MESVARKIEPVDSLIWINELLLEKKEETERMLTIWKRKKRECLTNGNRNGDGDVNSNLVRSTKKYLRAINDALERVKDGTFGLCTRCKNQISLERLEAELTSKYCAPCKNIVNNKSAFA